MGTNRCNILNRIFSRNTFRHCIDSGYDDTYVQAVRRYVKNPDGKTNAELISEIYRELKDNYRNEYYYKNTLLNKLLLGIHSVNTTTALTEVPIAKSKADIVLINGVAVVYEVKTELDNFDRMESQINDYYKVFDHVAVVTCEKNLTALKKRIEEINKPVGIYVLKKGGTMPPVRMPERYEKDLDPEILFKVLRKAEYEEILLEFFGELPLTTEFKYYSECKKKFMEIPIEIAYSEMIKLLKKRSRIIKEEFRKVPFELKFLAYFMDLKGEDYKKLTIFLKKPYGGV